MPKVSVIMGIYNVANTLSVAMDSLLEQTFQDFDIIMCDDGSTDETYQIAEQYRARYPQKITLLQNQKNQGLSYTLNICLKYAAGDYVARADGDDKCLPTRFEKQVLFLDEHPEYGFVGSTKILFDGDKIIRTTRLVRKPEKLNFIRGVPFHHPTIMIRREAYEKVHGYTVDKRMVRVEDVDLWFKLYEAGYKGYNIQEPLYMFRDDSEAEKKRKLKYRFNSTYTRLVGYRRLHIPIKYFPNAFRPILLGLLPKFIYRYLHKNKVKFLK